MNKCGLVVLNYIDFKTTVDLLDIIKDFDALDHIAVVDNNSPNNSYNELKKYQSEKISVIQSGKNGGYSYGNNVGIKYLVANFGVDIIGIANPDVVFDNEFVRRVKILFDEYPDYAVITGLMTNSEGYVSSHIFHEKDTASKFLRAGLCSLTAFMSPFTIKLQKIFHVQPPEVYKQYIDKHRINDSELVEVMSTHGSLFFARVKDFQAIGLFDENVFMYYEEEILSAKIYRSGKKVGVAPEIKFVHHGIHQVSRNPYDILPLIKSRYYDTSSKIYYFNNFVSDNKFLQACHSLLSRLGMLSSFVAQVIYYVWGIVKHLLHVRKES